MREAFARNEPYAESFDSNYVPIIFDPGNGPSEACTVYRQPENQEINGQHTPRLYHHISLLLPSGQVLVAGGRQPKDSCGAVTASPDPRFSGEVFSPPYLDFVNTGMSRPIVSNLSATAVFFEDTFTFEVARKENNFIDRVVLIRPGAITHTGTTIRSTSSSLLACWARNWLLRTLRTLSWSRCPRTPCAPRSGTCCSRSRTTGLSWKAIACPSFAKFVGPK